MVIPPNVSPGDAIRADWANQVNDALRVIGGGREIPGPMMTRIMAAMLAAIAPERFIPVRITAVNTSGTPVTTIQGPCWWPSEVTYGYIGIERSGVTGTNKTPFYGRPVKGDSRRIYPASVGMTGFIERYNDGEGRSLARFGLMDGCEIVAVKRCGG